MASPAIWRPPKFTGTQTLQRGLFGNRLKPGQTQTLNMAGLRGLAGRGGAPAAPASNPYSDLISSFLNQTRADLQADSVADAAGRDASLRRLIISYGDAPDLDKLGISKDAAGFLKGVLDEKTKGLARQNTEEGTSIKARLDRENMLAQRRIPAALAARGVLRSGQTGSDLGDQQLAYKQRGFDTLNELLGSAEGTVGSFLNAERERQRALAEAEQEAAFRAQDVWGDSYLDQSDAGPQAAVNLKGVSTQTKTRPPKPGPNYTWNGKRWIRKPGWNRPPGGGSSGGRPKVM